MALGPLRERGLVETWRSMRACAAARRREEQEGFDRRFGVDTMRSFSAEELRAAQGDDVPKLWRYWPTLPRRFTAIMNDVAIDARRFTFVDLGSGKGRVLLLASEWPFRRIVGVELCPSLHAIAEQNLARYRSASQRCRNFELVCADAAQFRWPDEPLVVYMFQPFPQETMRVALAHIPRDHEVVVAYLNPLFHQAVVDAGFRLEARRPDDQESFGWAVYRR